MEVMQHGSKLKIKKKNIVTITKFCRNYFIIQRTIYIKEEIPSLFLFNFNNKKLKKVPRGSVVG